MATIDKSKLKAKKSNLGTPPPPEDTKGNLDSPETAPTGEADKKGRGRPKSNRTKSFTTKFTPDFHKNLKRYAFDNDKDMGEVIETLLAEKVGS